MPAFLYLYSATIVVLLVRKIFLAWRLRQCKKYSLQAERLLLLVRELIDMAYIYENEPEKFYKKFTETVSSASMGKRGIIDPDALLHTVKYNRTLKELRREDVELWTLIEKGFSTRELKIMYGMKNINSVYVKVNRLRNRLEKRIREVSDTDNRPLNRPPPRR